jgi:hypothetical protein
MNSLGDVSGSSIKDRLLSRREIIKVY